MPAGPPPYKPPSKRKKALHPQPHRVGPKKPKIPGRLPGRPKLGYKAPQAAQSTKAPKPHEPPRAAPAPQSKKSYTPTFGKVGGAKGPSSTGELPKGRQKKGISSTGALPKPKPPKNPY